ncbi:MAG: lytic murein transglycosylase [Caulobacterales bacterium]|nr:lytic murein transglycosylase [Caulobacterales bacterium]
MSHKSFMFLGATILAGVLSFTACAQTPQGPYVPPAFKTSGNIDFDNWRTDFASRAVNQAKKDPSIIEGMLNNLTPNSQTIALNEAQPEFVKPVWQYINLAVNSQRIQIGKEKYVQNINKLSDISMKTGVPLEFAISIWGMETAYGTNKGNVDVVRALATFAYKGRRTQLGETELLAIADILQNNYATREQLIGSWAGAMGHTQFMPSSYLTKAIDGDKDGNRDIWNNQIDALASTMNFLKLSGWQNNEPWGIKVKASDKFDFTLADGQMRPLSFWKQNGISGEFVGANDDWQSRLLIPAGANGPIFLVGANYNAIRAYNASDSYSLSVAFLADIIAGHGSLPTNWPVSDPPLSRTNTIEVQNYLIKLGLLNDNADGQAGSKTRAALQAFQKSRGLLADGYVNAKALNDMRFAMGVVPTNPNIEYANSIKKIDPANVVIENPDGENGMPVKMKWPRAKQN